MSSEDESTNDYQESVGSRHRFAKPDLVKSMLESGSIPDAAMIHAARKSRQKARELGLCWGLLSHKKQENIILYNFFSVFVFFCFVLFCIGDFIALEEQQQENASSNKGRFTQDTGDDDDISDDDRRVDMSAITGSKEREERREQFYSVQNKCMSLLFIFI